MPPLFSNPGSTPAGNHVSTPCSTKEVSTGCWCEPDSCKLLDAMCLTKTTHLPVNHLKMVWARVHGYIGNSLILFEPEAEALQCFCCGWSCSTSTINHQQLCVVPIYLSKKQALWRFELASPQMNMRKRGVNFDATTVQYQQKWAIPRLIINKRIGLILHVVLWNAVSVLKKSIVKVLYV